MKNIFLIILIQLFLFNNLNSQTLPKKPKLEDFRSLNQTNLMKVNIGDSKNQVIDVMGGVKVYQYYEYDWYKPGFNKYTKSGTLSNPYSRDLKVGKDSTVSEILWYYTDIKSKDGSIRKDELTPIIFEKGVVIGLGWGFYEDYAKRKEFTINVQ